MNPLSPYHSTSSDVLLKRFRLWKRQYLHVVIYTSLFWIFVDVFIIMLFSDCTKEIIIPCRSAIPLTNNSSKTIEHIPPFRNPKIRLVRDKSSTETTKTTSINKWWDVKPGLIIN